MNDEADEIRPGRITRFGIGALTRFTKCRWCDNKLMSTFGGAFLCSGSCDKADTSGTSPFDVAE